jgi:2-(1,2-epoxy-1,2-dihydrophenyl)acetyl-CoA isomerase
MSLTQLQIDGPVARLTLNRPERHNSLVPALTDSLNADLLRAAETPAVRILVMQAAGASFSTGGDVAGFYAQPRDRRRAYAETLVGGLNRAILQLLNLPFPVISRVHGPVTGGSLGFLLASDLVAITPEGFIQPYYTQVGFSPDGGWTAMLPDRIGIARTREIQLLNQRIGATEAVQLGLATVLIEASQLDARIADWVSTLLAKQPASIHRTKALLHTDYTGALQAELELFKYQIDSDEADAGMARFLAGQA